MQIDYYNLTKLIGFLVVGFVVVFRGRSAAWFLQKLKRDFERSPLISLFGICFLVCALALAAFPDLRPAWLVSAVKYASIPIMILFFGSVIWMRHREKQNDKVYIQRQVNLPTFVDDSHRQFETRNPEDRK